MKTIAEIRLGFTGTTIRVDKPESRIGKWVNETFGWLDKNMGIEAYNAAECLEKLYDAFAEFGTTNIVRLEVDDNMVYEDKDEVDDDMRLAMDRAFSTPEFSVAQDMKAVMEYENKHFTLIITVKIRLEHKDGKAPLVIELVGINKEIQKPDNRSDDEHEAWLEEHFDDEDWADELEAKYERKMAKIVQSLVSSLSDHFSLDAEDQSVEIYTEYDESEYDEYFSMLPAMTAINTMTTLSIINASSMCCSSMSCTTSCTCSC